MTLALREPTGHTLNSLGQMLRERGTEFTGQDVGLGAIDMNFEAGEGAHFVVQGQSVRATEEGILALGSFLQVPAPFLKRFKRNVGMPGTQRLLEDLMQAAPESAAHVVFKPGEDGSIKAVREAGRANFEPLRAVEAAKRVLNTGEALVTTLVDTPAEFGFDVAVPSDSDQGVGGDVPSGIEVGDVSSGGLRVGMDLGANLAPWVQPYLYRFFCTNGMSAVDEQLKLDARGKGMDEVWEDFYFTADRAFKRTASQIEHFYGLRQQRVDNPERAIRAIARERGIPARSVNHLMDLVPTDAMPENPTMFDTVNLITNLANDHSLVRNLGGRRLLENAGGAVIAAEEGRCRSCNTVLVSH